MPLRQRGGHPIPLRRPHLRQLRHRLHLQRLRWQPSGSPASPPLFALSPTAEMDSIASPPTGTSADCPSPASSIAGSLTVSLAHLVYAEDFYRMQNRLVQALVVMCHGLMHDDGTPAIDVFAAPWSTFHRRSISQRLLTTGISCAPMIPTYRPILGTSLVLVSGNLQSCKCGWTIIQ